MKKMTMTLLCSLAMAAFMSVPAFAQELLVGGRIVGVQLSTQGVLVAELSQVETGQGQRSPAREAGVQPGDIIRSIGGVEVDRAADVVAAVEAAGGAPVRLGLERGGKALELSVAPAQSAEGQWLLGMWLRDGLSGIGTLTFQDPDSGIYGALGHPISDGGQALELKEGSICQAQIVSVEPGAAGAPGELRGCTDLGRVLGSIDLNTDSGIFGQSYQALGGARIQTGAMSTGPASMLSTISGSEAQEYAVEVNRIYRDRGREQAVITVTDPQLLAATGGIVQGMSGSPLIQNGKLVGAVTHVFIADPTRGYALGIGDMLQAAGILEQAA